MKKTPNGIDHTSTRGSLTALRCKVGDLAMVINEEPGCERNIGKLVIVQPYSHLDEELGWMWGIRSTTDENWYWYWCGYWHGTAGRSRVHIGNIGPNSGCVGVCHADQWLLPIKYPGLHKVQRATSRRRDELKHAIEICLEDAP